MKFEKYMTGKNEYKDVYSIPEKLKIPSYVALEGNVGAGKSTVAKMFSETYNYPHIGEYGNYVNFSAGEQFPTFPPNEIIDIINSNPLWIKLEYRRSAHLFDSGKVKKDTPLLIERSPLSLVAFEYAKMKQNLPFETSNLLGSYAMLLDIGMITEPSAYIFLNTSPEVVKQRIIKRGGRSIDFLFTTETCSQIENFYDFFKKYYLQKKQYKNIQTDKLDSTEIAKKVGTFIQNINNSETVTAFNIFCHDMLIGKINFENI